jgi:HAD superfamily phosphatase (TIGR01668 family)
MLLHPDAVVTSVTEVTPELLRELGVRAVMVDLDDTLVPAGSELLEPLFRAWLRELVAAGFPVVILSNGERKRVERYARELEVRGLALVGKPFRHAFRRGLELLGTAAHETAMVGDQLFTDVLGANLIGLRSVLVSPLSPGKLLHTRALRRLERRLLRRWQLLSTELRTLPSGMTQVLATRRGCGRSVNR